MDDKYYTYIYYDPTRNNEPFYVGKGCRKRAWDHLKRADHHPMTTRIKYIRDLGKEPIIGIYAGLDEEMSLFLEEELIQHYGRKDLNRGPLVNLTDGGDSPTMSQDSVRKRIITKLKNGTIKHTDEAKQKMSESAKKRKSSEETKLKISQALKGRPRSDETREKISKGNSGLKRTPEQNKANSERVKAYNKKIRQATIPNQPIVSKQD